MSTASSAILAIEDDPHARLLLQVALRDGGYECLHATTGIEGVSLALKCDPSVVLLDVTLPDIDGLEVTRRIRERSSVPIIVISARTQEAHKIALLEAGSNDYLTKPFSAGELIARIHVALRGHAASDVGQPAGVVTIGDLTIDFDRRNVTVAGRDVLLSPIEYRLLSVLVRANGRVMTNRQILRDVWGARYAGHANYLRVYMSKLGH